MSIREQTCTFCNAVVAVPDEVRAGELFQCPRCEERFRVAAEAPTVRGGGTPSVTSARGGPRPPLTYHRLPNRTLGFMVLGVMLFMGTMAALFIIRTEQDRRANDSGLKQSRSRKRPTQPDIDAALRAEPLPPLRMPALGLLPSEMDLLSGVHVRAVLQAPEGRRLLEREVPGLKGSIESRLLKRLEAMTGILVEEIDHLVVGFRLRDNNLSLAVKTRRRIDRDRLVKKLQAVSHPEARGEAIYRFPGAITPIHVGGMLNWLDDETFLLGWARSIDDVRPPRESKLKPELESLLGERVNLGGPVWLAGSLDEKQAQSLGFLQKLGVLGELGESDVQPWLGIRAAALWLTLEGKVTINAVARAADVSKREALQGWLKARLSDKQGVEPVGDREWVTVQYRP